MASEKTTLLEFPCDFAIKIFGAAIPEVELAVFTILQRHIPEFSPHAIVIRPSKNNKYQAITATIIAVSQQQLDAIYQDLSSNELVIMVL